MALRWHPDKNPGMEPKHARYNHVIECLHAYDTVQHHKSYLPFFTEHLTEVGVLSMQ